MLETFEPRIHNVSVGLNEIDTNEVSMVIYYTIKNSVEKQSMEMTITRAR